MDEIPKERMLRRLKDLIDDKWGQIGDKYKVLREIYLTDSNSCIHDDYLGDDVMSDIINKFYYVFEAVREEFDPFVEVYIVPSCEDDSAYFMILDKTLLVKGHSKAWNFWWESEEELMEFMYEAYCQISKHLAESVITPEQEKDSWEPQMAIVLEGGIITTVATKGKGFAYRVIDIDALKVGDENYMEDLKPDATFMDIEQFSAQAAGNTLWGKYGRKESEK
jgi:hypothetical protein